MQARSALPVMQAAQGAVIESNLSDRTARRSTRRRIATAEAALERSLHRLDHAENSSNFQTTACIAVQSFLLLGLAIALGPSSGSNSPKQIFLGLTLTSAGLLAALIELAIGHNGLKRIEHWTAAVRDRSHELGVAPKFQEAKWDSMKRCHTQPGALSSTHQFIGHFLPGLLIGFWLAVAIWVLWPW